MMAARLELKNVLNKKDMATKMKNLRVKENNFCQYNDSLLNTCPQMKNKKK